MIVGLDKSQTDLGGGKGGEHSCLIHIPGRWFVRVRCRLRLLRPWVSCSYRGMPVPRLLFSSAGEEARAHKPVYLDRASSSRRRSSRVILPSQEAFFRPGGKPTTRERDTAAKPSPAEPPTSSAPLSGSLGMAMASYTARGRLGGSRLFLLVTSSIVALTTAKILSPPLPPPPPPHLLFGGVRRSSELSWDDTCGQQGAGSHPTGGFRDVMSPVACRCYTPARRPRREDRGVAAEEESTDLGEFSILGTFRSRV